MSPARRRLRTLEASLQICASVLALRILPVRLLLPPKTPDLGQAVPSDTALIVRGAIRSASARLPFKPSCLAQSLAAVAMLKRRHAGYGFHIGARMTENFEAHAWVESGGLVVAGEGDVGSFSVLLSREQ